MFIIIIFFRYLFLIIKQFIFKYNSNLTLIFKFTLMLFKLDSSFKIALASKAKLVNDLLIEVYSLISIIILINL